MKYLVISDIHGASQALEQALSWKEKLGAEKILLLGDILYHGPRNDLPKEYAPKEVIAMLNPLKNQIYAVYSELTDGVDTESRPVIVAQNIKRFEVNEDIRAEYQNNIVVITQGDGKGSLIHGSFDAFSCGRPVKPKSWIAELFGHE